MKYRDKSWLEQKYHEEGLSQYDIAAEIGVSRSTIDKWMRKLGVSARPNKKQHAVFLTDRGYERWYNYSTPIKGEPSIQEWVDVHRLACVAWYGFDAILGKEVHHINNIPWDNRQDNIVLLSKAEHSKITMKNYYGE